MTDIKGPLTILGLETENVKRIKIVKLRPDGSLVQITGKNGQGKSSLLDAIEMALSWATSVKPADPIRKGTKEAFIKLDMGEIRLERTFRKTGKGELYTELRIESASGANISSPQTFLNALLGHLSFNPLDFMDGTDAEKYDALKSFVPGVDFDEVEAQNQTDYAKRTDENRKAKDLIAQAAGIMVPANIGKKIDVAQVVIDLEAAEEHNKTLMLRRQRRKDVEDKVEAGRKMLARLRDQLEDIQTQIANYEAEGKELADKLARAEPLPDEIDTAELRAKITQAQTVNADIDKAERKAALLAQAEQHEKASQALTDAMEARSESVRAAIAAAEMPVPGLTLADGKVYLDGIELKDSNRAAQLQLSLAVAMAKNPRARVILIREGGNDLDEDAMALIATKAEEHGYQIWIERLKAEGGPPAIIMEDGHAKD